MANLSPETLREMLSIIREARNDLKKLSDTASMVSSALSKPQELTLKKKAENPFSQEGEESVLLKFPSVCEVVDGRNHQLLATKASGGQEMSRNLEIPLGNFVEHMVGYKQLEISVVENSKVKWYHDRSTSTVTFPLPRKPPDPPDLIYGKNRKKGTVFPKYSCEEVYERMEMGLCVFCEEFDTPGHYQLKHKGLQVLVMECDDEEEIEELVDSVSVVLVQKENQATDQEYEKAKDKLADYCSLPNEYQDDSALLIKSSNNIELLLVHESSDSQRSVLSLSERVLCLSGIYGNEEHRVCLSQVERIWEPGGFPAKETQWHCLEKCESLWFSAATSNMSMMRPFQIQAKELLSKFQDVPRLLVSVSAFGAIIHKPLDPNEKLLCAETLGRFIRVKKLNAGVRFNLVPSKKANTLLGVSQAVAEILCDNFQEASCHSGVMLGWFSSGCVKSVTDENILVNKLCHQGYCLLMFLVQDHIIEALFSHFLAGGTLLVSYSNLQPLLVSYSIQCHRMIYLDSSEENIGFAITRRWLSAAHLLCSMGISLLTAVLCNRKTEKREDESRLSWDALLVRYKELKHLTEKICEDLIQAGYEWLISNYSCHKANTVKQEMQDDTDFNQFLFDTEMFQVKHKWRYKPFPFVTELELKDETALGTINEDVLSCNITGQARDVVVSLHVEVGRTIEMSQVCHELLW